MRVEAGKVFGFLTVIEKVEGVPYSLWLCRCECGNTKAIRYTGLCRFNRPTRSCGCKRIELLRVGHLKHGHSIKDGSPGYLTFICWEGMIQRCKNKNGSEYKNYGGRGISVCKRWASYENFLFDMGIKPEGLSIERIDNNGNYETGNCRWATPKEQANNKRTNRILEHNGIRANVTQWAEKLGVSKTGLLYRLSAGWSVERALTQPVKRYSLP